MYEKQTKTFLKSFLLWGFQEIARIIFIISIIVGAAVLAAKAGGYNMAKEYFTKTCPACSGRKLKVQNKIRAYFCPRCKTSFPKAKQTQEREHIDAVYTID